MKNITIYYGNTKYGDKMFEFIKKNIDDITYPVEDEEPKLPIFDNLQMNISYLKSEFGDSFDILYKEIKVGNADICFVMADGMCENLLVVEQVVKPIISEKRLPLRKEKLLDFISKNVVAGIDQQRAETLQDAIANVLSGLVVLFVDGVNYSECFGVQGFPKRSIDDAIAEVEEIGSHEAFTESFKDNITLLRRRIRSPVLKCEIVECGKTSKTRICVCYMSDRAKPETVNDIKTKIKKAKLDTVLGSGYLRPFLDSKRFSFFSALGTTERPDVACAEMAEGRVLIITDGTPFAIIAPYLFSENFQTMDDYNYRPFYATLIRTLKFVSFFIGIFLPGIYIAICTFHQEVIPVSMLYDMAIQESITPFPVMLETVFIHFIYEIVREAGLRMPKSIGQTVGIVGAIVIGEAAVSAGLVAAPLLIVVGLSAITSFVVPHLYQPIAFLRFAFMVIGGIFGFYGIVVGASVLLVNMCAANPYGVPLLSPIAPFSLGAMRDNFFRMSWKKLGKRELKIDKMEK